MSKLGIEVVPVTAFQQNCTLLWDTETMRGVVIDPGGDLPKIEAAVARAKITLDAIWLTHGHIDHAGEAENLRDTLHIDIIGPHEADRPLLDSLPQQGAFFGLAGIRAVRPARFLAEGETLKLGPHTFDILHCPGHTPGHVVFIERAARFAQLGDVLFQGSVGRTDFPYGDHAALIGAIKTKLLPLGDDLAFICGHGPPSTIGAERRSNPFLQ